MQHHSFFRNLPPFIHCSYLGEVMQLVAKTSQKTSYISSESQNNGHGVAA